ncbi:TonB-dependent receptor [Novosphingobium profundi]|nr:TonB-dependent receptor [Novosphingobium profundi]
MAQSVQAQEAGAEPQAQDVANGDIIVTANRVATVLSKTPVTMSAISADTLRDVGITDARSLGQMVPNVALNENGDAMRISIRGVTSTDTTEKGDPSAAFLKDGVYIARPADMLGSFYDLERVEVLRGPQGTLYGRNTTAGVINVLSARPKDDFEAKFDGGYGNFNTVDATGVINTPLTESLALRAAVNYHQQDPYYKIDGDPAYDNDPYARTLSGRLSLGGTIGSKLDFVIVADYSRTKGSGVNGNGVTLDRFFPDALVPTVDPQYVRLSADEQRTLTVAPEYRNARDNKTYGVMGEFTYDFGPLQLTYLGSYRESKRQDVRNLLLFGVLNNPAQFSGHFAQSSHELRMAFGTGNPLHGQAGLYYFRETSGLEFGLGSPLSSMVVPGATNFAFPQDPTKSVSKAAFGQLTYDITPDLHLTGGLRYTQDAKSRNGATVVDFADTDTSICGELRCVLNENIASRTFKKTTWKIGVDYDAPGLGLIYGSVSTGYKAGGFNDGCVTGSGVGCALTEDALYFNPEMLTAYEAGFKFRFGSAFRLTGAVFHYDYSDMQVSQVVTVPVPATLIRNAASSKVDGVELESTIQPGMDDRVDLTFAYTNARYADFTPDATNYPDFSWSGKALDHSPKYTATVAYTHTFPLASGAQIDVGGRMQFSSEYFMADLNNLSQFRQPSFHKSDLTATYKAPEDRYYIQAYVKNLENEITLAGASSGLAATAWIEAPRTYGLRAGMTF